MIVETFEQFEKFLNDYKYAKEVIFIPILADIHQHPENNTLSLLYVKLIESEKSFILSFDHSETLHLEFDLDNLLKYPQRIFVHDKKVMLSLFSFDKFYDVSLMKYLNVRENIPWNFHTGTHRILERQHNDKRNVNRIVPVVKHVDQCEKMCFELEKNLEIFGTTQSSVAYKFYNEKVIPVLYRLESSGIGINPTYYKADKRHINNNVVYSEYNIYTSTGRPSSRHGNVNYAALNKKDDSRKLIVPRNDALVIFDYSAYHIQLMARLVDYQFPRNLDVHLYLGQQYGEKNKEDAKSKNFRFLYGKAPNFILEKVPFFQKINDYTHALWEDINDRGFIESPISSRRIYLRDISNANPEKVFNYLLQCHETEVNIVVMEKVQKFLEDYSTSLVLYVYDSLMFDYSFSDGKPFLAELRRTIEMDGILPTSAYFGKNYQNLCEFTEKF